MQPPSFTLLEKERLPGLRPVRLPCGGTDEMKKSDQEISPHTLVNFARRLMVNFGSPLTVLAVNGGARSALASLRGQPQTSEARRHDHALRPR